MTRDSSVRWTQVGRSVLSTLFCSMLVLVGAAAAADNVEQLYQAAGKGDVAVAEQLISAGVDVNAKSSNGSQALNAAAASNHHDMIKLLLANGAKPNVQNEEGDTPLICATKYAGGDTKTVRLLINAGSNLSIADNDGKTALDYAMQRNQSDAIALLEKKK